MALSQPGNTTETVLEALREQDVTDFKIAAEDYQAGPGGPGDPVSIPEDDEGPYFPVWQFSPAIPLPQLINFDMLSHDMSQTELKAFIRGNGGHMLGSAFNFDGDISGQVFTNLFLDHWKDGGNVYEEGPLSYYYTPVYESFDNNATIVGVLEAFIYWQVLLENILPTDTAPCVVVLQNTCNQSYSFLVGKNAVFLGDGDLHDSKYSHLQTSTDYGIFLSEEAKEEGCFYRVMVFPSQDMVDAFLTKDPIIFTVSLIGVFVFTVAMFLLYDCFVERRQKVVLKKAIQSSAVVNKLFPDIVRERLFDADQTEKHSGGYEEAGSRLLLKKFLKDDSWSSPDQANNSNPIADEYPECTVLFADIAGFTKWCSTRTPS